MVVLFPQSKLSDKEIEAWNARCIKRFDKAAEEVKQTRLSTTSSSPIRQWYDKNAPPDLKSLVPDSAVPDVIDPSYHIGVHIFPHHLPANLIPYASLSFVRVCLDSSHSPTPFYED